MLNSYIFYDFETSNQDFVFCFIVQGFKPKVVSVFCNYSIWLVSTNLAPDPAVLEDPSMWRT